MCEHNFFPEIKRKVVSLVIYPLNYDSSKSSLFIWHLTFSWAQLLSNKWELFVSCNTQRLRKHPSFCSGFWDHGEWNIIFKHLYQIHFFFNNLNEGEMIKSHFMCVIKRKVLFKRKKQYQKKNLVKHVT